MAKIYRHDELCILPGDKPNEFESEEAAQTYLDDLNNATIAKAASHGFAVETAQLDGWEIRA